MRGERIKRVHTYVKMYMNIVKMRTKIEMLAHDYEYISKRTKKKFNMHLCRDCLNDKIICSYERFEIS